MSREKYPPGSSGGDLRGVAARELETEDDQQRMEERPRQAVKHKPVEKPGQPQ